MQASYEWYLISTFNSKSINDRSRQHYYYNVIEFMFDK